MAKTLARRRRLIGVAALTSAAAICSTVAAVADTTSNGPVFTGCLNRTTGLLTSVTVSPATPRRCLTGSIQVSWNQQGQPGPAGSTGPQGPAGPQGASGVSHAYAGGVPAGYVPADGNFHEVASMVVPDGHYAVTATGSARSTVPMDWECHVSGGDLVLGTQFSTATVLTPAAFAATDTINVTNGRIAVSCLANDTDPYPEVGTILGVDITAIAVDAVTF